MRKRYDVAHELTAFLDTEHAKYGAARNHTEASFNLLESDDLRARLLIASQEMYGEHDRLAAEASFRVNVALPMTAFAVSLYTASPGSTWPSTVAAIALTGMAIVLFVQGVRKHRLSDTVLMRAVLAGVIEHPSVTRARLTSAESTPADEQDADESERLRKHVRRLLQGLATAHNKKAVADEEDDAPTARYWQTEIKNLEHQLLTFFDAD